MRSNTIEKYKKGLKLSRFQREILVGLLLGDATLETQNGGRTYRLKIEQSQNHSHYANHLYQAFQAWVLSPPRTRRVMVGRRVYEKVAFSTVSHPAFRFYAHQFYDDRRKRVPELIHRWLTPAAMAYWFMDDGSIKSRESKGVIFNTQGFSLRNVETLCATLKQKFVLDAEPRRQREGWQIYISGRCFEKLSEIMKPYIIDSMMYKFPQPRRT